MDSYTYKMLNIRKQIVEVELIKYEARLSIVRDLIDMNISGSEIANEHSICMTSVAALKKELDRINKELEPKEEPLGKFQTSL